MSFVAFFAPYDAGWRSSEKGGCVFRRPVWLLGKGVILNDLSVGGNEMARRGPVLPDADARFEFSGVSHDRPGIVILPFRIFRRPQNQAWGRRVYPNPMSNPMFSDGLFRLLTFVQFPRQRVAGALNQDNKQHEEGDDEDDDFGLVAVVAVADGEVAQAAAAYHACRRAV